MARQHLFRVWDGKTMHQLKSTNKGHNHYLQCGKDGFWLYKSTDGHLVTCTKDGGVIMQHTGLFDKKGKDIYEGDIVRIAEGKYTTGGSVDCTYEVVFHTGAFRLEYNGITFHWLHDSFGVAEVIGNIHQNPELLK